MLLEIKILVYWLFLLCIFYGIHKWHAYLSRKTWTENYIFENHFPGITFMLLLMTGIVLFSIYLFINITSWWFTDNWHFLN